ncbi:MAG: PQQ-dependent sugar dehydrogenase [Bryobacteraceae bacterium]
MRTVFLALLVAALLPAQEIRLTQVAQGLSSPTDIQHSGDGSGRLFLVEQRGLIKILRNGSVLAQPFLDLRSRVTQSGNERGLLGLAFPPSFAQSQRFYVNYTNAAGNTVIAQYRSNGDLADASSEIPLLTINQPFENHNGGQLRFGSDGFLYIGLGDGGSSGDPQNNAQNLGSLLGKILRIDVESQPGQVRIPPTNPFVNTAGARPEIWAFGLRNPWRFSFDRTTREMWIGDVGQGTYEEIDLQPAGIGGQDYGWRVMEGMHCYQAGCSTAGKTLPVAEYSHAGGACSVTGGFVYRGSGWPALQGTYFYTDYCTGRIWGLSRPADAWTSRVVLDSGLRITTFGEDEPGELFAAAADGRVFRIDQAAIAPPRFNANGVVNSASFVPGIVPGSLATVFVSGVHQAEGITAADAIPLPLALDAVSVTVGGVRAPLLSVSNVAGAEQVNFQVPFEIAGRSTVDMVVARAGGSSAPQTLPVLVEQPGVYASPPGRGIAVHNANYSLVTDAAPLVAGEVAFLYASGLGAVTNAPATGAGAPANAEVRGSVRVTLGEQPCQVLYAGLAPGFVGVYQVNFRVPSTVPSGLKNLVLGVGAADAPVVMLPVR